MPKSHFYGRFIRNTGQGYKLTWLLCATAVGCICLMYAQAHAYYLLEVVACLIAFGGFFGGALSVSCPRCGCRYIWEAMRRESISRWTDVLTATRCPQCAFEPSDDEK
jgi:hypothetical protein